MRLQRRLGRHTGGHKSTRLHAPGAEGRPISCPGVRRRAAGRSRGPSCRSPGPADHMLTHDATMIRCLRGGSTVPCLCIEGSGTAGRRGVGCDALWRPPQGAAPGPSSLLRSPGLLRRVATARAAHEALELLLLEAEARGVAADGITEDDCARLISAALEQGTAWKRHAFTVLPLSWMPDLLPV